MCLHTTKDPMDLGFNEIVPDDCDYLDYSEIKTGKGPDKDEFTIMQLNIRGILNKQSALKQLMTEIKRSHQLDVILLAKTWLKKSTENQVKYQATILSVPIGNIKEGEV